MGANRLEAFSDGVIAVIITIMVLERKVPRDTILTSLRSLAPRFLSYLLSFLVVAIMWVNHHHLIHAARRADARLLWSNNILLFWMSLVPFVTALHGQQPPRPARRCAPWRGAVAMFDFLCVAAFRNPSPSFRQPQRCALPSRRAMEKHAFFAALYVVGSAGVRRCTDFVFHLCVGRAVLFFPESKLAEA